MALSLIQYAAQTQVPMMQGLVDQITNESVFLKLLKFIDVDGLSYRYNRREALGGIAFRGLNENYSTPPSVINPQTESMAIFGGEVQTDAIIYDRQGDVARANEIGAKLKNAGLFFDRYVIKGDPAVNAKQFYGLNSRISGKQLLTCGTNGGALTQPLIDQLIDAVVGTKDKYLVCNKAVRRNITALLRTTAKPITFDVASGQVAEYDGVPILILDEDGDQQPILDENETMGSSNVTTSLYCLRLGGDTDKQYLQGLVGTNMIVHRDVGLLGTFYLDVVEMLGSIAVFHPRCAARLAGIIPQ